METEPIEAFVFDPKQIPTEPGCYLFYDKNDEIIYVGKAKNIRKRTSSYFQKTKKSPKTESLVKKICRIDTRTVSTEMEALILENSLIKQHRPKYNILLRDDKNFLYLRVTSEEEPKMELTRRLVRDGSTYIGPRTSSKSFRKTIAFCQKFFGVKMVNASYDNYVSKLKGKELSLEDYKDNIRRMKKFLRGDTKEVIAEVKERMMAFAKDRNFEAAAKMRDLLIAIDGSTKRQTIEFTGDFTARDFVHFHRDKNKAYFVRMVFRNGKFVDLNEIKFRAEEFATDSELVKQFLLQFYPQVDTLPKEIFVPALPEDLETVIEFLMNQSSRRDKSSFVSIEDHKNTLNISHDNKDATNRVSSKLTIHVPERGDKRKVLEIASTNAQNFAAKAHITALSQAENFAKALPELTDFLGLEQPIRRIECYDISHFSGQQTVGSQVTFIDGQPYKNAYRRYKIESLAPGKIDDFASMQEVLGRRFARLIEENNNKRHSELDSESSISLKPVKTDDDWKFYHDFGKKLFALVFPNIEYNEKHPDLIYNKNHPFLVINSGKAIGSFRLDEKAEARIILRTFFISESERNKSFGTQVLQQVEAWCLDREKKSLVSNAHSDAVSFYEKNGFKLNFWKGDSGNDKCVPMGKIIKKETGKTIIKKLETEAEKKLALTFAAEIFGPMGWSTNIEEKKLDETKNSIWAAYKDEKMIGMLRAGKFVNTWWNLKDLAIGTENRRQGIGTKLIDEAKTHILKNYL
jgi:excinuclease ABC subunit C